MDAPGLETDLRKLAAPACDRACHALGLLLHEDTQAKGWQVYRLTSPDMLLMRLGPTRRLMTITKGVAGEVPGKVSLVLAPRAALKLVDMLIGRHGPGTRDLGGLELDALRETANIVSGSYLALFGPTLGVERMPCEATVTEGSPSELVRSLLPDTKALCVEAHLAAPSRHVELTLLLAVTRPSTVRVFQRSGSSRAIDSEPDA